MNDQELERTLTDLLARRADDVTEAPSYQLREADTVAPGRAHQRRRPVLMVAVAAAVVAIVAVATFVGWRADDRGSTATRPPTAVRTCPLSAAQLAPLLAAGAIRVDQPQNAPVSAGPDGAFLMQQTTSNGSGFSHNELALFDRAGQGITVWNAADPALDNVVTNPTAAVDANWVVFGTRSGQQLANRAIIAWDRSTRQPITARSLSAAELQNNQVLGTPVVIGDTAFWLAGTFRDPASQQLISWDLRTNRQVSSVAAPDVSALLRVGQRVAFVSGTGGDAALGGSPDVTVPAAVRAASRGGNDFTADAATIAWIRRDDARSTISTWTVGTDKIDTRPAPVWSEPVTIAGRYIAGAGASDGTGGAGQLYDSAENLVVSLDPATTISLVSGTDVILSAGPSKFGSPTVARVAVTDLEAACG